MQERRLLEQAERLSRDGGDGSAPDRTPFGSGELPAAPDRQPSAYAQVMHDRFPVGRSTERALRELPTSAPGWQVAFHRRLGWGSLAPFGLLAAGLGVALLVRAL